MDKQQNPSAPGATATEEPLASEEIHSGIPIQCKFCVGDKFRRSRVRAGDLKYILLMRYPVRCLRCSQRQWLSFTIAAISVPSHIRHKQRRSAKTNRRGNAGIVR